MESELQMSVSLVKRVNLVKKAPKTINYVKPARVSLVKRVNYIKR